MSGKNYRLVDAMREKGMSLRGLAEAVGTSKTNIDNYIHGTEPGVTNAWKVAKALGCTVEDLWGDASWQDL